MITFGIFCSSIFEKYLSYSYSFAGLALYGLLFLRPISNFLKSALFILNQYSESFIQYPIEQTVSTISELDDLNKWPFDQNMFLILNVAVGADWGGYNGVDDIIFPQEMEIDYVRIF